MEFKITTYHNFTNNMLFESSFKLDFRYLICHSLFIKSVSKNHVTLFILQILIINNLLLLFFHHFSSQL